MILFRDLRAICRRDEPMARHTSFHVGGPVRYFLEPRTGEELELVCHRCQDAGLRLRVLGRGCNTLVTDGPHFWAVVSTRRINGFHREGTRLEVGAGYDLGRLVSWAEGAGLAGLEPLAGIPGSVGGAVAMNAGGRHGCIGDRLLSAVVAFPGRGPTWVDAQSLGLAYRTSSFHDGRPLLLSATFGLEQASPAAVQARRRSILDEKRASQPFRAWSAGCVFKNPPGDSAGRLIDAAGLKGLRVGDAEVSRKHANFVVNRGKATARQILELIALVSARVHDAHGVRLELEIEVWAEDGERSGCHGRA